MIGFRHFFTYIQEVNNKFSSSVTGRQYEIMQEHIPLVNSWQSLPAYMYVHVYRATVQVYSVVEV